MLQRVRITARRARSRSPAMHAATLLAAHGWRAARTTRTNRERTVDGFIGAVLACGCWSVCAGGKLGTNELTGSPAFALKQRWHTPCYDKLSKLDWIGGFGVISHGVSIGIRVSDASLLATLRNRLPGHAKAYAGNQFDSVLSVILGGQEVGSPVRKFHLVYHNHSRVGRSHQLDEVLDRFDAFFTLTVAMLAPRRVFVHAGAVAWKGRAILIPGQSLAGKSTLVMELVRAGATYLSDEFAVLDGKGRVHPYPKPISMRETPQSKQLDVPVESIGGIVGTQPVPLGLVVVATYKESARWRPKSMSSGEGILALLSNCPAGRLAPERVLRALACAATAATFIKSPRGDAVEVAPLILQRSTGSSRRSQSSHSLEHYSEAQRS